MAKEMFRTTTSLQNFGGNFADNISWTFTQLNTACGEFKLIPRRDCENTDRIFFAKLSIILHIRTGWCAAVRGSIRLCRLYWCYYVLLGGPASLTELVLYLLYAVCNVVWSMSFENGCNGRPTESFVELTSGGVPLRQFFCSQHYRHKNWNCQP